MAKPREVPTPPKRIWRMSRSVPLGEIVGPDAANPDRVLRDSNSQSWFSSSLELQCGLEVSEATDLDPDTVLALFSRCQPP